MTFVVCVLAVCVVCLFAGACFCFKRLCIQSVGPIAPLECHIDGEETCEAEAARAKKIQWRLLALWPGRMGGPENNVGGA